ncbi:type IV secretion system protein [Bartonella vinsonii]|uniref:TrwJ protein n=1 Tax=Bartonella vinsonii subsp. berkhoffii str. Tweed TaxID=1094502 RepID=N6VIJ8_BARVB|nr:type IV secretion system protein [Bartonella vinsonii]ENN93036.1 TrwJ protein [Bartonella vinsonii subsp. berkhoffii str. Tweed]
MRKLTIIVTISVILATLNSAKSAEIKEDTISLLDKIHKSITGIRAKTLKTEEDDGTLLLPNPQYIYDQTKQSNIANKIPELFRKIIKDENYLHDSPVDEARETLDWRSQYAAVIDKVILLQAFQETEKRFEEIAKILTKVTETQDLKDIAELELRMKGMLAMIQNESTKLQMVAHSSNTEQALINRLKRKRNVQILQQKNTQMPTIR